MAAFILGIGMGNHHTIGFMLIPVLYVFVVRRKDLPFGTVIFSILLFLAGFSVYWYLYFRTLAESSIVYSRADSFVDFLTVFFRAQYSAGTLDAVKEVSIHGSAWFYAVKNIWIIMSESIHPLTWFFILAGIIASMKDRKIFGYLFVSLVTWVLFAKMTVGGPLTARDIDVISPYFLPLILILGVLSGMGLFICYEKIKAYSSLIPKVIVASMVLFQIVFVSIAIQKSSLSDYFIAYNWIKDISNVLKPKSFFLAFGDNPSFLSFYGFGVERLKDDALVLDASTGDNNFRTLLSPEWKFSIWYPEFYQTDRTPAKYFYPLARQGKFYASNQASVPLDIKRKFDIQGYVLTALLLPKGESFPLKERFEDDFKKINYLPVLTGNTTDVMAKEILRNYLLTIWQFADVLSSKNEKDADYYYRLSLFITRDKSAKVHILKDYLRFLKDKKGVEEARRFISRLEEAAADASQKKELADIEKTIVWQ